MELSISLANGDDPYSNDTKRKRRKNPYSIISKAVEI